MYQALSGAGDLLRRRKEASAVSSETDADEERFCPAPWLRKMPDRCTLREQDTGKENGGFEVIHMKIGIFDSGIGGLSVLHRAMKMMPKAVTIALLLYIEIGIIQFRMERIHLILLHLDGCLVPEIMFLLMEVL